MLEIIQVVNVWHVLINAFWMYVCFWSLTKLVLGLFARCWKTRGQIMAARCTMVNPRLWGRFDVRSKPTHQLIQKSVACAVYQQIIKTLRAFAYLAKAQLHETALPAQSRNCTSENTIELDCLAKQHVRLHPQKSSTSSIDHGLLKTFRSQKWKQLTGFAYKAVDVTCCDGVQTQRWRIVTSKSWGRQVWRIAGNAAGQLGSTFYVFVLEPCSNPRDPEGPKISHTCLG